MKRYYLTVMFFVFVAVSSIGAGGIREYKGQPYRVNEWTPTNVQQFVKAGTFDVEGIRIGPDDSPDGTFKNGVYYWGGPVSINSDSVLYTGWSIHFRLSDKWQTEEEYSWMTARYTGKNRAVSKTETYTVYGTIQFTGKEGKEIIEIVYIEPYNEDTYRADEPVDTVLENQAEDEQMKRRITITGLPPLPFTEDSKPAPLIKYSFMLSLHNNIAPATAFTTGMAQQVDASFTDTWSMPAGTTVCTVLVSIRDQNQNNKVIRALSKKYVSLERELIILSFDDFQEESVELLEKKFGIQ
ncbi:MAG: hypothetical protein LBO67_03450 [Spirochaetaceae bacterium]|jgi:hypothetical protein|nr:hypothetical protein [Spirochaetaceae bacterium]